MYFVETSIFTKKIHQLLSDEEYRMLQMKLLVHPDAGNVIKHSGGIRKLRGGGSGRGKLVEYVSSIFITPIRTAFFYCMSTPRMKPKI